MATIFCFTSTGNSLYVSKKLAEKIGADVLSMSKPVAECEDSVIGFVFPVFFWGLPKIVEKFVSELKITNKNAYIFAIVTYGGKVYGVPGELKKLLEKKGLSLQYGRNIKSVENYIPGYKVNNNKEIHQKVDEEIDIAANEIAGKKKHRIQKHTFVNEIIYGFFPGKHGDCDKNFAVTSQCTKCGQCQRICPVRNITLENGMPGFRHNCEHCLACLHICPVHAIEWKQSTKDKERYINPGILSNELISFIGIETKK